MPGDEVIVPAVTWSTSVWPIIQAGAIPRFVDCDPTTLQVTPETVKAAINEKTVGICAVHILGNGLDGSAYAQIANEHGLWLIEDTCESLGVKSDNKHVGTFGDIGTYSFYFSHHITSVEGGMVVTDDDDMANLLRSLRSHGWTRHRTDTDKFTQLYPEVDPRFMFITTGFNVRPTDINAAIGLKQLPKLEGFNAHRRDISAAISAGLKPLADEGILSLIRYDAKISAAPFGYPVICSSRAIRDKLQKHLENSGIETRPIICGNMTRQPAFQHYDYLVSGDLRGADAVMDCGLYWGTHPGMTQSEVDYIVNSVRECFAK
ncbi:hypothetical protein MoryE10_16090 [Methylogaea oryzae]|uniref:DegT/DnrJ/EryC1/StrS family aminotransferase n=2 Tax=Methylogaea oryzae TaxID=1295382 RepID=A0A8D4VMN6_9GAMM|nr:hypothetical protein MoryE10_16090 [Methylogaea oryzae]